MVSARVLAPRVHSLVSWLPLLAQIQIPKDIAIFGLAETAAAARVAGYLISHNRTGFSSYSKNDPHRISMAAEEKESRRYRRSNPGPEPRSSNGGTKTAATERPPRPLSISRLVTPEGVSVSLGARCLRPSLKLPLGRLVKSRLGLWPTRPISAPRYRPLARRRPSHRPGGLRERSRGVPGPGRSTQLCEWRRLVSQPLVRPERSRPRSDRA